MGRKMSWARQWRKILQAFEEVRYVGARVGGVALPLLRML